MCPPVSSQNTKVTITDQEVTTTSSPTGLHPRRLSLRPSPPTSWALDLEPWRDPATIRQTTKGSRTWSLMQKPRVRSQAYRAPCSLCRGRPTGEDPALLSHWLVTPATVLLCPTKARRWEKPQPGKGRTTGTFPGLDVSSVNSGDESEKYAEISTEDFLKSKTDFHNRRTDGHGIKNGTEWY